MPTIRHIVDIDAEIEAVWSKIADTSNISGLIGFLAASEQTGDTRVCTLADGAKLTEKIVSVEPALKRVLYAITDSPLGMDFHAATMELSERPGGTRLIWNVDILPESAVANMAPMLDAAAADMRQSLA